MRTMETTRTTVIIPKHLLQQLKMKAVVENKSLSNFYTLNARHFASVKAITAQNPIIRLDKVSNL